MLVSMKEILDRASKENYGVVAPNVCSELDARAVIEIAEELHAPIILDGRARRDAGHQVPGQLSDDSGG